MNKTIKLLVAIPYFPPHIGGMEKHVKTILVGLKNNYNYDIVVVTSSYPESRYKVEVIDGLKIYQLPCQFKVSNTPVSLYWKNEIKKIIKIETPDIINGRGPVPFMADISCALAQEMQIPFILGWHFPSMKKGQILLDIIIWVYENFFLQTMLKNSRHVICSSTNVKETLLSKYQEKVTVITQGLDMSHYIDHKTKRVAQSIYFVGNLESKVKGLEYLLQAIKKLVTKYPKIKLNVVGYGRYLGYYQSLCRDYKIDESVNFVGEHSSVEEYNRNEIFICPSTSENFPSTMLEAMGCGIPVIATRVGNIPDFINDGINGILVDPKNSQQIADKIKWLFDNPEQRAIMAKKGKESVQNRFDWDTRVQATHKIIKEVLNQ